MTIPVQLDIEGPAFSKAMPDNGVWPFPGLTPNFYRCIAADPPWHWRAHSSKGEGRSPKYPRMSLADIKALPVADLAATDCVLLLWAVDPMLPQALEVMKHWGFEFRTVGFYWAKVTRKSWSSWTPNWLMGLGYWTRCLPGQVRVHILDFDDEQRVKQVAISSLHGRDPASYMIWSHTGWRAVREFVRNGPTRVAMIDTRIGTTASSWDHRWAHKRLKTPRLYPRSVMTESPRRRVHVVEYATLSDIDRRRKMSVAASGNASVNLVFSTRPIEHPSPIREMDGIALTDDTGWLVGIFAAEGSTSKDRPAATRYTLSSNELHLADRICRTIDALGLKNERYFNEHVEVNVFKSPERNSIAVYHSSLKLRQWIARFVLGNGAHGKRLNLDLLLQTSVAFRQGLLMGMLDGDGTKGPHGFSGFRNMRLCNAGLVADFRELSHGLGIMTSDLALKSGPDGFTGKEWTSYGLRFVNPRNQTLTLDETGVLPVEIKSIDESAEVVTYDISVEGEAFVADWLVSHNSNPEQCLLGVRGKPKREDAGVRRLLIEPVREHSRKPEEFYSSAERLVAGPRCELFSRRTRPGWTGWGLDHGQFDEVA